MEIATKKARAGMVARFVDWVASVLKLHTSADVKEAEELVCVARNGVRECTIRK
jgi:hypothetical protein